MQKVLAKKSSTYSRSNKGVGIPIYRSFDLGKQLSRYKTGQAHLEWGEESRLSRVFWNKQLYGKQLYYQFAVNWGTKKQHKHNKNNLNTKEIRRYKRFNNRQRDFVSQIQTLYGNFNKNARQLNEKNYTQQPKDISDLKYNSDHNSFYFKPQLSQPMKRPPSSHISYKKEVLPFGQRTNKRFNLQKQQQFYGTRKGFIG